ncbi:hypothetical protein [Pseudonocardia sp. DLS-67]
MTADGVTPRRIRLGVVRGISHGLFGPPDDFMTPARTLGARLVRVYVYWSQVEPARGRYDWRIVDDILAQLDGDEDAWITVCSSSPWATRTPTDFQPPSPAVDDEAYSAFVTALVARCSGRIRYWQCNNEPSNTGLLWAGTAAEYVHQLELFAAAVRRADPAASVVLGGCGYDVLSSPPGSPERTFFDQLAAAGRDSFDLFDLHLYDDPAAIPEHVETARGFMLAHGYVKPVVVGEYNGPTFLQFPLATAEFERTFVDVLTADQAIAMSTQELAAQLVDETPDRRAVRLLYERRDDLPAELAMFLADAPAELAGLRERLGHRQLVQRALLALACGVDVLACWNLAPEVANHTDRHNIMDLMFGSLALMDHEDGAIRSPRPRARAHRLLAALLTDATDVRPVDEAGVTAVRIESARAAPVLVAWTRPVDPLDESGPPARIAPEWSHPEVHALDVHGRRPRPVLAGGRAHLVVGPTPVLLSRKPLPNVGPGGARRSTDDLLP